MIPVVAFDVETTSTDPLEARIVSAAIVLLDENGEPLIVSTYLVDAGVDIPEEATKVHGITTEHARENGISPQLGISAIATELAAWQAPGATYPLVAFNAAYDLTVLDREHHRHLGTPLPWEPWPVLDPFVVDRYIDRYRKGSRNLATVSQYHRVEPYGTAHDAESDAITAGRLAQIMLGYPKFDGVTPAMLHEAQINWAQAVGAHWADFFHSTQQHERGAAAQQPWPIIRTPIES